MNRFFWLDFRLKSVRRTGFCNKVFLYLESWRPAVPILQEGITLLLINLDGNTTVQVRVSTTDTSMNGALGLQQEGQSSKMNFTNVVRGKTSYRGRVRAEYHLTPKDGNLQSRVMLLNGKVLGPYSDSSTKFIPSLEPINTRLSDPIVVAPSSIVFAQIPSTNVAACK